MTTRVANPPAPARLAVRAAAKRFGAVTVLDDVDLALEPGERCWIAGPNGAGKSTLLDLIAGGLRPDAGSIALDGRAVERLGPHRRADLGIARNWQLPAVFVQQTVRAQLEAAIRVRSGQRYGLMPARDCTAEVDALAQRIGLVDRLDVLPAALPHAQRRLLDLAFVFAAPARLILLDEPSAGLSRHDAAKLFAGLAQWTQGATVLIIEHDRALATQFADRALWLEEGRLVEQERLPKVSGDRGAAHA